MTKITTKDPYAFNGGPLTKVSSSSNTDVLSKKKDNIFKVKKQFYIESYGCQMNFSDSEIVASILNQEGYELTEKLENANLVLVNTCSIREKAEQTVRKRLELFNGFKRKNKDLKIGVLGCMAERLKHKFLEEEKMVDIVVGPDAYKDLPNLLREAEAEREAV
ncbi:MAG: tRNA (N6-isopentenyl adenosine(37)-C2)-methylthiotransferase MiaB, partial [Flavobacteriaceae bacterium]